MRKAWAFLLLLLLVLPILLYAQEQEEEEEDPRDKLPSIDSDWDYYEMDMYVKGDKTFIISLGTVFPTVFVNNGRIIERNFKPPVGGTGSLSYNYFFNAHIYIGGEIQGMFAPTIAGNTLFIIPLGLRTGYQFIWRKLEFPVGITLGMTWHRYLNLGYYGFYMKGGGAAYFRFNADWSFGLSSNWCWFPEWTNERRTYVHGNFVDLMLSVRYHF